MTRTIFIAAALALAATLPAAPAAQAAGRTFVSAAGNDSNPCTITLPCRNLQAAYNAVAANGEVDALDPGNYGSLTITRPVNIQGHGWAGMSANTGAAITINSPGSTDKIAISGVVLDGLGITGTTGIQFNSGGSLTVLDSVIRNFTGNGILFAPSTSNPSKISVINTQVSDNNYGIYIGPTGSGTTNGVLDHVHVDNNTNDGLAVASASSQTINVTVSDSVSANNGSNGITAFSANGMPTNVMVRNSAIADNSIYGLYADAPGASIRATRSAITGNGTAWFQFIGGQITSYADNNIEDNGSANNAPVQIIYK